MSTRELLPPPSALKLYNRDMRKLHGDNFQPFSDLKDIKLKNKYMEMAAEKAQKPHYKRPPSAFNLFIGDYMETHKHDNNLQKDKMSSAGAEWKRASANKKLSFVQAASLARKKMGYVPAAERPKAQYTGYSYYCKETGFKISSGQKSGWMELSEKKKQEWKDRAVEANVAEGRHAKVRSRSATNSPRSEKSGASPKPRRARSLSPKPRGRPRGATPSPSKAKAKPKAKPTRAKTPSPKAKTPSPKKKTPPKKKTSSRDSLRGLPMRHKCNHV